MEKRWKYYNPNPRGQRVGDCTVRAICSATGMEWEDAYIMICLEGLVLGDMPSGNNVWGSFLSSHGFYKALPPVNTTVKEMAEKEPYSAVMVCVLSGHVVTVKDGHYFDTWDSGDETVLYYWVKEETE